MEYEKLMARALRLAVIHQQYKLGNLTEDDAKELLSGPLSPDDPSTIVDDSQYLNISFEDFQKIFLEIPSEMIGGW